MWHNTLSQSLGLALQGIAHLACSFTHRRRAELAYDGCWGGWVGGPIGGVPWVAAQARPIARSTPEHINTGNVYRTTILCATSQKI